MERITKTQIELAIETLNALMKRPLEKRCKSKGLNRANVGNFHLYSAYGKVGLHETVNESGGARDIVGLCTKRELYNAIQHLIRGIRLARGA
jgi:hypothetical protein